MASNSLAGEEGRLVAVAPNVGDVPRDTTVQPRKGKKRGRKPLNVDAAKRIELSRQNARECRARKKLRYQYVEELVVSREKAVEALRQELATLKQWCVTLDGGQLSEECVSFVRQLKEKLVNKETS